jgi:mannose-1-phosphate guanylyltransferase
MSSTEVFAVLMAGGSGTRFWPASRRALPKQYLPIGTQKPLIRETFERLAGLVEPAHVLVVASRSHKKLVRALLPELPETNLLLEPVGRNTTPCIAWAASAIEQRAPASVQIVLPSDHVIHPAARFRELLATAVAAAAREELLITLGVQPSEPAMGFGYIECGEPRAGGLRTVRRFVEKPERARAEEFLRSGNFLWNAGIFVWSTAAILAALQRFAPQTLAGARKLDRAPGRAQFARLESISIDKSVMERASNVCVIPLPLEWNDVGSWNALPESSGPSAAGGGALLALESSNCIAYAPPGEVVALLGVRDLVVVHAGKVTLVCPRERAQDVRALVAAMEQRDKRFV